MIYAAEYLNAKKSCRLSKKESKTHLRLLYLQTSSSRDIEHVERCCIHLSDCIDNLPQNAELFILGDLNVDLSKKNTLTSLIKDLCKSKVLTQHVTSPTRVTNTSSTTIDLVFSNSVNAKDCKIVDLRLSDHSLLHIRRDKLSVCRPQKRITSQSYKSLMRNCSQKILGVWTGQLNVTNTYRLDRATEAFNKKVLGALDRHAPITTKRVCYTNPPWVNNNLLQAIKERKYLKKSGFKVKPSPRLGCFQEKKKFCQ